MYLRSGKQIKIKATMNFERRKNSKDYLQIGPYAQVEKWLDQHLIAYEGIEPEDEEQNAYVVYIKGEALQVFFHFSEEIRVPANITFKRSK